MQVEMRPALQFVQEGSLDVSKWEVESRAALGLQHAQKSCSVEAWDHMNTHTHTHHYIMYMYIIHVIYPPYASVFIFTHDTLYQPLNAYIYIYTHTVKCIIYIII